MTIQPINSLAAQRAALEANSLDVFSKQVMQPIERFWKPHLQHFAIDANIDPAIAAAKAMGFYNPTEDRDAGLRALDAFDQAGTWQVCVDAMEKAHAALAPADHGLDIGEVQFTLLLGSLRILREQYGAYTGFQQPGMAMVMGWPNAIGTPRLPVASAHELNHIVRFQYEPWTMNTTVGQYMVAEGLAESFGVEVLGDKTLVGPYSTALTPAQIDEMRPRFKAALETTGFDVMRSYIFGDWAAEQFHYPKLGIPDYAGYTIGYEVVQAFLARTGMSAAEATYVPWREIVEVSKWFVEEEEEEKVTR
jgi:uncharacterized protein YjaZ